MDFSTKETTVEFSYDTSSLLIDVGHTQLSRDQPYSKHPSCSRDVASVWMNGKDSPTLFINLPKRKKV